MRPTTLNITTWRRAMVMMLKGKAESLEQDSTREIRRAPIFRPLSACGNTSGCPSVSCR